MLSTPLLLIFGHRWKTIKKLFIVLISLNWRRRLASHLVVAVFIRKKSSKYRYVIISNCRTLSHKHDCVTVIRYTAGTYGAG